MHGINVRTSPEDFEMALQFIAAHYSPIRLDDILDEGRNLPHRPILVTFDDAYASVADIAAPLCKKYRIPAVFFVNGAFLDNQRLAADNLVCYVASVHGMTAIRAAVREVVGSKAAELVSLAEVFSKFFPTLTLNERREFIEVLKRALRIDERFLARESSLYLSSSQLRALASLDCEIGNHTYSHTHCRRLSSRDFVEEIDQNKAMLEAASGTRVRAFSQPYGSSVDLTAELLGHLKSSGHKAAFLSESVANENGSDNFVFDRINPRSDDKGTLFCEIEILPRLRAIRDHHFRHPQKSVGWTTASPRNETQEMKEQRGAVTL